MYLISFTTKLCRKECQNHQIKIVASIIIYDIEKYVR